MTPDVDVATYLAAQGFGTIGTDLFHCAPKPPGGGIPDACIFVLDSGGPAPDPYFRVGGASASFYRVGVQVRVRAAVGQSAAGKERARDVLTALHLAAIAGYTAVHAQTSAPLYLGRDDTEHDEWSVNCSVWFKE